MAGTSRLDGTDIVSLQWGVAHFLNAVGIPSTAYSYPNATTQPSVLDIAGLNVNQTVVTLALGWYALVNPGDTYYTRGGGHIVTVLGQGDPGPDYITIANPAPSSLQSAADLPAHSIQKLPTSNFTGATLSLPADPAAGTYYLQFPNIYWSGFAPAVTPVLEWIFALTVDASQVSANHPVPARWDPAGSQVVDTNGARLVVFAPLGGVGELVKQGTGVLDLYAADDSTGPKVISAGVLASNHNSATPFGTGSINLTDATLRIAPSGTGAAAKVRAAGGNGSQLTFAGACTLQLIVGLNASLTVTLGGARVRSSSWACPVRRWHPGRLRRRRCHNARLEMQAARPGRTR